MEKENKILEYRSKANKDYLKTVSAFANYASGRIIFGVNKDLSVSPIKDMESFCTSIESQIKASLKPVPEFYFSRQDNHTVILYISQGGDAPYLYQGKAYGREGTSTFEIDDRELKSLTQRTQYPYFEIFPSQDQNLTFDYFSKRFKEHLKVDHFDADIMKILGLYSSEDGYNMTANLLSDKNDVFGLRITVYGESENIIKEEIDLSGESLLKQFDDALNVFERTYTYEKINDTSRQRVERIPLDVFREALADSLIHRSWEANEHTQVSFYPDSIRISSPKGLTYKGFDLRSRDMRFLTLKNPTLSFVFYRLGLVHDFVMRAAKFDHYYEKSYRKPEFNINSYSFDYYLPAIVTTVVLTKQEMDLLKEMNFDEPYSRSDLEENLGINKATLIRLLNSLIKKGVIIKEGKSSATTYLKVR